MVQAYILAILIAADLFVAHALYEEWYDGNLNAPMICDL